MSVIDQTTMHLKFPQDFFKDYAKGKPCQVRIARLLGYPGCASDETTVLSHISLAGMKAMGKKLVPDLCGAWACDICHGLIDGRYRSKGQHYSHDEIQCYHLEGMARTINELVKAGVLPNP